MKNTQKGSVLLWALIIIVLLGGGLFLYVNHTKGLSVPTTPMNSDQPSITILDPKNNRSWKIGSQQTIKWTTSNIPLDTAGYIILKNNVNGGDLYIISRSIALNGGSASSFGGSLPWTIPSTLLIPPGNQYTVRFGIGSYDTDYYNGGKYFDSEVFTISE